VNSSGPVGGFVTVARAASVHAAIRMLPISRKFRQFQRFAFIACASSHNYLTIHPACAAQRVRQEPALSLPKGALLWLLCTRLPQAPGWAAPTA